MRAVLHMYNTDRFFEWPVEVQHTYTRPRTYQTPTHARLCWPVLFGPPEPSKHRHLPVRREASLPPGDSRAIPARSCILSVSQLNLSRFDGRVSRAVRPGCERFHSPLRRERFGQQAGEVAPASGRELSGQRSCPACVCGTQKTQHAKRHSRCSVGESQGDEPSIRRPPSFY